MWQGSMRLRPRRKEMRLEVRWPVLVPLVLGQRNLAWVARHRTVWAGTQTGAVVATENRRAQVQRRQVAVVAHQVVRRCPWAFQLAASRREAGSLNLPASLARGVSHWRVAAEATGPVLPRRSGTFPSHGQFNLSAPETNCDFSMRPVAGSWCESQYSSERSTRLILWWLPFAGGSIAGGLPVTGSIGSPS